MAFTKINAAGIGTTETVTVDGLTVINDGSFGGNLTVSGVLTYEDVTNVDSVGLITARNGIVVGSGITLSKDGDIFATGITTVSGNVKVGTGITLSPDGDVFFTGVGTGNGSGLTALNASNLGSGTVPTARLGSGTASSSTFLRGDSTFQTVNTDLVSDTSPQLGGTLDTNGNLISFPDSGGVNSNRLKIGTGNDIEIFHVSDNSYLDFPTNYNAYVRTGTDRDTAILIRPNNAVDLYYDNSKRFETTSAGAKVTGELDVFETSGDILHVQGNSTDSVVAKIENAYTSDNDRFAVLEIKSGKGQVRFNSNGDSIEGAITYEMANNAMIFGVNNATEQMRITSTGDVIMGTSSYAYTKPLNVQGSTGAILSLANYDTTTYAANTHTSIEMRLNTGNTGNQNGSCEIRAFKENGTNGDNSRALSFYTAGNGASPSERLRIASDGFVTFNNDPDTGIKNTNTNTLQVHTNDTLCTEFSANQRVRMPQVYSTAGSSMRDVQIESDGTLAALSSITAAKINIADVTDVSWLYNLKAKTFNFRKKTVDAVTGVNTYLNEAEDEKVYGLLAEDVETINKDFCFYDKDSEGNDVLAGVYYKTMVVPLLKAVQDLKSEIDTLKTKVAALEG